MCSDAIAKQRERVKDAYVAWQFAIHFTKECLREGYQQSRAQAEENRALAEYRFQLRVLEDLEAAIKKRKPLAAASGCA